MSRKHNEIAVLIKKNGGVATSTYTFDPSNKGDDITLSNGNLTVVCSDGGIQGDIARGISAVSSGKWYWEMDVSGTVDWSDSDRCGMGWIVVTHPVNDSFPGLGVFGDYGLTTLLGRKYYNGTGTGGYEEVFTNSVIMSALDLDNGKVWWGKNGTWFDSGDPAAGTGFQYDSVSGTFYAAVSAQDFNDGAATLTGVFSEADWTYEAPSGFSQLEGP